MIMNAKSLFYIASIEVRFRFSHIMFVEIGAFWASIGILFSSSGLLMFAISMSRLIPSVNSNVMNAYVGLSKLLLFLRRYLLILASVSLLASNFKFLICVPLCYRNLRSWFCLKSYSIRAILNRLLVIKASFIYFLEKSSSLVFRKFVKNVVKFSAFVTVVTDSEF